MPASNPGQRMYTDAIGVFAHNFIKKLPTATLALNIEASADNLFRERYTIGTRSVKQGGRRSRPKLTMASSGCHSPRDEVHVDSST